MIAVESRSAALERLAGYLTAHDPTIRELDLDAVYETYNLKKCRRRMEHPNRSGHR